MKPRTLFESIRGNGLRAGRIRDAAVSVGFVLAGGVGVNLIWLLRSALQLPAGKSLSERLALLGSTMLESAWATFPALPVAALIVWLAPKRALWRTVACALAYAYLVGWCWYVASDTPWRSGTALDPLTMLQFVADSLDASLSAALLVWALAFRRSAANDADTLLRSQIDTATLESELQRARLRLLRAQIEPHFLFNTLANMRTLARTEPDAAVELIDHFMRYLSAALPRLRRDEASLAEEMSLIDAYLNIFRVRMGRRLSYEIAVPAELADFRIPTMLVLTLVENALKHGINPVLEGGSIRISARREGGVVMITVADSGRGMQSEYGYGTGLANLHLRLISSFGTAAQLSLAQAEPRGVVATMRIPAAAEAFSHAV